jgi:hypothetical protein
LTCQMSGLAMLTMCRLWWPAEVTQWLGTLLLILRSRVPVQPRLAPGEDDGEENVRTLLVVMS